ncbi:MAG: VOC family protein [Actinomycetota bacterium]
MKLDGFNLVVSDMAASVAFFELLGLDVPSTMPEFMDHHRTVVVDGGTDFDLDSAEFAEMWNPGWPGGAGGPMGVLGFRVDSRDEVDAVATRMAAAGHALQREPADAFWGSRYAIVEDPDGNAIGIMSPPDEAFRSAPPIP